jgi:type IV pilus assembly protein PilM
MIFSNNSYYPIGLDISDLSLRFIQLRGNKDKPKIQSIGAVQLNPNVIQNGEIKNYQSLANSLNELLSKPKYGSVSGNKVVACLPETKTFIKLIKVSKSPNNINDLIGSEVEKYIPISINDIYFDWQIISESPDEYTVLIGAAQKNTVNQYIQILNEANLCVWALEIESTAICRALLSEEKPNFTGDSPQNYAIVDIGSKRTSLIVYANKSIVLSISIPISGEEVTDEISKTLEINHEQAEKAKIICGLDQSKAQGIIYKILSGVLDKLNTRIIDTIDFYGSHYSYLPKIDKLLLCGGGANIKNITTTMSESIKIPTFEANPFNNLAESKETFASHFSETHNLKLLLSKGKQTEDISLKQDSTSSFATAIGLALRNVFTDKI